MKPLGLSLCVLACGSFFLTVLYMKQCKKDDVEKKEKINDEDYDYVKPFAYAVY